MLGNVPSGLPGNYIILLENLPALLQSVAYGEVGRSINFDIGYFEGKQSKKRWLCCQEDLKAMYKNHRNGDEIMFWCEARTSKPKK